MQVLDRRFVQGGGIVANLPLSVLFPSPWDSSKETLVLVAFQVWHRWGAGQSRTHRDVELWSRRSSSGSPIVVCPDVML